jgi:hypothetical protein
MPLSFTDKRKQAVSMAAWLLLVCSLAATVGAQTKHTIEPSPLSEETRRELEELDKPHLATLHSSLRGPLEEALSELRSQGWRARISRARRTKEEQREAFDAGYSKTLRSKHLCGKAADIMLHPHIFPEVSHPFWDAKDRAVERRGLKTLDVPSFRDRPHVELASDCDWDSLGMGPVGEWEWRGEGKRVTLNVTRSRASNKYEGTVDIERVGRPVERRLLETIDVRYTYSGERNSTERVTLRVRERALETGEVYRRTFEVSTLTSAGNGYTRADWMKLRTKRGTTFARVAPSSGSSLPE